MLYQTRLYNYKNREIMQFVKNFFCLVKEDNLVFCARFLGYSKVFLKKRGGGCVGGYAKRVVSKLFVCFVLFRGVVYKLKFYVRVVTEWKTHFY